MNYCQLIWEFYRIENKNNTMNENLKNKKAMFSQPIGGKSVEYHHQSRANAEDALMKIRGFIEERMTGR